MQIIRLEKSYLNGNKRFAPLWYLAYRYENSIHDMRDQGTNHAVFFCSSIFLDIDHVRLTHSSRYKWCYFQYISQGICSRFKFAEVLIEYRFQDHVQYENTTAYLTRSVPNLMLQVPGDHSERDYLHFLGYNATGSVKELIGGVAGPKTVLSRLAGPGC